MHDNIKIFGAKTHGLKNINVEIPHDKITVITGLSGSGKSSLAIDTLFAEGQRRYVESLSSYARQFLNKFEKAEFEKITGLRPAIAIEQKTQGFNPRSTTGTVTEIYDYLRVLYATIGVAYSPTTNEPLITRTPNEITQDIYKKNWGKLSIIAPISKNKKGSFKFELAKLQKDGFMKAIINQIVVDLDFIPDLDKNKFHNIDLIIGEFNINQCERYEIELACTQGLQYGKGVIKAIIDGETYMFSSKAICPISGFSIEEITPKLFSFNNPVGACPKCLGLGKTLTSYSEDDNLNGSNISDYSGECLYCKGKRLNGQALCVKIQDKTIYDIGNLSLINAKKWINIISSENNFRSIIQPITEQIDKRLSFLINVGLGYLTLNRSATTLSGGESQRIRLASQIGSCLEGVLYVLDEPSIGLHPQDNQKLIDTLKTLKELGNTIVIIEHDQCTMEQADYIIELGPKAGIYGGEVTFAGTLDKLLKTNTITAQYLKNEKKVYCETKKLDPECEKLKIIDANFNNISNLSVEIPTGYLIGICGVSGSGKSSLIEILINSLGKYFKGEEPKLCKLDGTILNYELIDQSPIGKTPRSTPATYTGIMTPIREWFASLPESKARGYTSSRFSFNLSAGQCNACNGEGVQHIQMHFMPNTQNQCSVCGGRRYNNETLEILYNDMSIYNVLDLSIEKAYEVFKFIPNVKNMLQILNSVHLGYLKLGQNAVTLSGGEAQRLKLAKVLGTKKHNNTIYILDEPTTGLHFEDIQALLQVLRELVKQGHTVLTVEHNIDILKMCDWLIEIGPEAGEYGGKVIFTGEPYQLKEAKTNTGIFL